jgi:two-component system response regulator GlrR
MIMEIDQHERQLQDCVRDTVYITRGVLDPGLLEEVVGVLESAGHNCAVVGEESLAGAFADPRLGLLLLSASCADLSRLAEAVRTGKRAAAADAPVLLHYLRGEGGAEMVIHPEFDDFLLAPFDGRDLLPRVRRLLQSRGDGADEVEQVKASLTSHFGMRQFIGRSAALLREVEKLPRVAASGAPVLLIGETGTGKEMCARAVHYLSPRAAKPFIPVNCGSIPHDLFESEMFGHEAGAFTDARQARRGLIAEAEGGTLFLDEVDSLPLLAQVKLLRFLQEQQYRPLGATGFRRSDTRLVVASNQNLLDKVREGKFREDLYYRLRVITLHMPSLKERPEDVIPLATHFLKTSAHEYRSPVVGLSHEAAQKLKAYHWPGNVRELENVIRQAVVLASGATLRAHDLQLATDVPRQLAPSREPFCEAKARVIESFERYYLQEILHACDGNISRAAREAQKDRRAFFALLKKHGLANAKRSHAPEPAETQTFTGAV